MRPVERKLRPRIIAALAASVDGKIDSVQREGAGFSSRLDRDRLDELRSSADALIVGAATIRAEDPPLRIRDPARRHHRVQAGRPEDLIVVVLTRSANVPPAARFLREPAARRMLALPLDCEEAALQPLTPLIAAGALEVLRAGRGAVDIRALVSELQRFGCTEILVEGGGEVVGAFLEAELLDELRLTICPTVIGGRGAPTPVGGAGWPLVKRRALRLIEIDRAGDELYLRYAVERSAGPGAVESRAER